MRLDEIETELATAIAALDATDYQQGTPAEVWSESDIPMPILPELEPDTSAHLVFSVLVESAPDSGMHRNTPGDTYRYRASVSVYFAYRLRPDQMKADARLQLRAAQAIATAVNDEVAGWDADADVVVQLQNAFRAVTYGATATPTPYRVAVVTFAVDGNLDI